jgi:DNA invertase Pin-like site-specific DNA recombinase
LTYCKICDNLIETDGFKPAAQNGGLTVKVGYARVSTQEQNEARQLAAFTEMGIGKVFLDKQSGKNADRPQLKEMLSFIREGDTVVCESISRMARNTKDLLAIVDEITKKKAEFISLKESIDTTTATGKFMLTVFAAMAELERETTHQRQAEGIAIAKAQGKYHGRQPIAVDKKQFAKECKAWREGKQTAAETMRNLKLKPNTFYRRVRDMGV